MSLDIETILCRAGRMDNYAYLLTDKATGVSAVVDPSEAEPVISRCEQLGRKPSYILNTHHHYDHTDANLEIKNFFHARVVAPNTTQTASPAWTKQSKTATFGCWATPKPKSSELTDTPAATSSGTFPTTKRCLPATLYSTSA